MIIYKTIATLCLMLFLSSCKPGDNPQNEQQEQQKNEATQEVLPGVQSIETAHNKDKFLDNEVIKFDIDLNFNGSDRLDATIYLSTDSRFIRIDKVDGSSLIYDGSNVWSTPQEASLQGARFDIFTWSYFFALPYKLSDPGAIATVMDPADNYNKIRLTFEQGTGDAPDDWYEIYSDPQTGLLAYAGYIVTYGGTPADRAAQNAHAIGYSDYQRVNDIPVATQWSFYNYDNKVDTTQVIGNAVITDVAFIPFRSSLFEKPTDAVPVPLP